MVSSPVTGAGHFLLIVPACGGIKAILPRQLSAVAAETALYHVIADHPAFAGPVVIV